MKGLRYTSFFELLGNRTFRPRSRHLKMKEGGFIVGGSFKSHEEIFTNLILEHYANMSGITVYRPNLTNLRPIQTSVGIQFVEQQNSFYREVECPPDSLSEDEIHYWLLGQ